MKLTMSGVLLVICCAFTLFGCGDEGEVNPSGSKVFDCLNITCDTGKGEICVFERYAATKEAHSPSCVVPASSCSSCDCAEQAAIDSFDGGSNCDGAIACSSSNGAVIVQCTNPFI